MDYEKEYKNALKRAKDCHVNKKLSELVDNAQQLCEYIFPELKMSKDEKIKREIIKFLKENKDFPEDWIAWLKKQGETYTKKDVDNAYLQGICDAKRELEKQGEKNPAKRSDKEFDDFFNLESVIDIVEMYGKGEVRLYGDDVTTELEWLKSLRDRLQSH